MATRAYMRTKGKEMPGFLHGRLKQDIEDAIIALTMAPHVKHRPHGYNETCARVFRLVHGIKQTRVPNFTEIGRIMGTSPSGTNSRYRYAVAWLKEYFAMKDKDDKAAAHKAVEDIRKNIEPQVRATTPPAIETPDLLITCPKCGEPILTNNYDASLTLVGVPEFKNCIHIASRGDVQCNKCESKYYLSLHLTNYKDEQG